MNRDQLLVAQVLRERIWGTRKARHLKDRLAEVEEVADVFIERFTEADTKFDAGAFARVAGLRKAALAAEAEVAGEQP